MEPAQDDSQRCPKEFHCLLKSKCIYVLCLYTISIRGTCLTVDGTEIVQNQEPPLGGAKTLPRTGSFCDVRDVGTKDVKLCQMPFSLPTEDVKV